MKKLTKEDLIAKAALLESLGSKKEELDAAVVAYNEALSDAFSELETAVASYNEAVVEANEWLSERKDNAEAFYEERSDSWKEGDRGQAYQEWMDSFSEEGEEIDATQPYEIQMVDFDFTIIDTLENIQTEPSS